MNSYLPDVEIVDVDEWDGEPTCPGVHATTAQLAAEAEALVLVRQYVEEMRALELGGGEAWAVP